MPRNNKHKNIIQIFRNLIKERIKLDLLLIRQDWIEASILNGLTETYADNFRRNLTILGYLEETDKPGVFRCLKTIPCGKYYYNIRDEVSEIHRKERLLKQRQEN